MQHPVSPSAPSEATQTILSEDQQAACERLCLLRRVRASTGEAALPANVLRRWTVPLLVGAAGTGKEFVCQEAARRLGNKPCRRWEAGAWVIVANRASGTTLEQIEGFISDSPQGCVIYLAGIDSLGAGADRNLGYHHAVVSEVEQLLDWTASRPARFVRRTGGTFQPDALVVVGGRFSSLWGDHELGGPTGSEAWKNADREPLMDARAVASWIAVNSGLPAGILRRLAAAPLVLRGIQGDEAEGLAARLRDGLPGSLDGLGADEFRAALQGPQGWRAVAALVEQAWVDGHADVPWPLPEAAVPAERASPHVTPKAKSSASQPPARLGERLGIPCTRSRLLGKTQRFGLRTVQDLESLAVSRGFTLPGEIRTEAVSDGKVGRQEITDTELAAALLSPCLAFSERTICRGALTLAMQAATVNRALIVCAARRARGEAVVRHVAWMGRALDPQSKFWRDLLALLPHPSYCPALRAGVMPDGAIRGVLSLFLL